MMTTGDTYYKGISEEFVKNQSKKFMKKFPMLSECNPMAGLKKDMNIYDSLDNSSR